MNNKMRVSLLVVGIFLVVVCSCLTSYVDVHATPEDDGNIQWKNHNNTILGLSVDYPSTWNVQEKQNRFEDTNDLTIKSFIEGPDNTVHLNDTDIIIFNAELNEEQTATMENKNITALANSIIDAISDDYDYDTNLEDSIIEGVNTSRYTIDGEDAASLIFVHREKQDDGYAVATESLVTVHNNKIYTFDFQMSTEIFDTQRITEIRKHMFDSMNWLN